MEPRTTITTKWPYNSTTSPEDKERSLKEHKDIIRKYLLLLDKEYKKLGKEVEYTVINKLYYVPNPTTTS